jgi:hypothetical protein
MTLPTLKILPDQGGYQVQAGPGAKSTKLDGGLGRYRADQLGAAATVSWVYTSDGAGYDYLQAFYRHPTLGSANGSEPFLMWLMFESHLPVLYKCCFIPGSITTPQIEGLTYKFGATIECTPMVAIDAADAAILTAWIAPPDVPVAYVYGYDAYAANLVALYSTRRMLTSYDGPLLQACRYSDNRVWDIYALPDGSLDLVTLAAFYGVGGTGYVKKWYDQAASNGDSIAPGNAGPDLDVYGVMRFNGAVLPLPINTLPTDDRDCTVLLAAYNAGVAGDPYGFAFHWGNTAGLQMHSLGKEAGSTNAYYDQYGQGISGGVLQVNAGTDVMAATTGQNDHQFLYLNGVQTATSNNSLMLGDTTSSIGSWDGGALPWIGSISTLAVWAEQKSGADIAALSGIPA